MIEVKVKNKNGVVGYSGKFVDQAAADAWIQEQISECSWGRPERWVDDFLLEAQGEDQAQAIAEETVGGPDSEFKRYKFACDYSIETEDVTAAMAQAKTNQESLIYLSQTDWYVIRKSELGTDVPAEVLALRAAARAAIVR